MATFLAYNWLVWAGASAGRFVGPRIVTPPITTVSSGCEPAQLPPRSAAMSTITLPGRIFATISAVTSSGALWPGMSAVQITTSLSATTLPSSSRCLA